MARAKSNRTISNIGCMIMRIMAVVTAVMGVVLIASAYGGYIDPRTSSKIALFPLGLPYVAMLMIVVAIVWLLLKQFKFALLAIASIAISFPSVIEVIPLHTSSHKLTPDEEDNSFKVLSFNAYYFAYNHDNPDEQKQLEPMRYLLVANADIACVQEGPISYSRAGDKDARAKLIKEIRSCYPYHYTSDLNGLAIYSKRRFSIVKSGVFDATSCYVLAKTIINGRELYVLNVHLESIGLNSTDKELFMQYTRPNNFRQKISNFDEAKANIGRKLMHAFEKRAEQADSLRSIINGIEGNVILCGDFNDTPCSYAYNVIKGDDMHEAYASCGLGPTITYHDSRLWLKIDHIMHRGNLKPISVVRSKEKVSDHYPLVATYLWDLEAENQENEKNNNKQQ